MKNNIVRVSALALVTATAFGALSAHAKAIRFDPGDESGNEGAWSGTENVVFGDDTFSSVLDLGFDMNFGGGTATGFRASSSGAIELVGATGSLGTITLFSALADGADFSRAVSPDSNPLAPFNGDPITDALRLRWNYAGFQAQLVLFGLGSGDSLLEFNYLNQETGFDASAIALGVVSPTAGIGFDLGSFLTTTTNGSGTCRSTLGADYTLTFGAEPTGCSGYFTSPTAGIAALPPPFATSQGGAVGSDDLADFRYLLRYPFVTQPPTSVPEPGTALLLLSGLASLAIARRKKSTAR